MQGSHLQHPVFTRRTALQAGAIGLMGLSMEHLGALRAEAGKSPSRDGKSVIYIFLSGGLSQLDSFDLKPEAPDSIRGEFRPRSTRTPGLQICEHLPMLAQRSHLWTLVRSLTHLSNEHSAGHMIMLSGRTPLPPRFSASKPQPTDWPSITSIAGALTKSRNNLPPVAILPEKLVHRTGRVIPGAFAGQMGQAHDPWLIEASPFDSTAYGAFPEYEFDHQDRRRKPRRKAFRIPDLTLPQGLDSRRLEGRLGLLAQLDQQRRTLDTHAATSNLDHHRQTAISLLTHSRVRAAFDLTHTNPKLLDRYGNNAFGWSLLMARRLVQAGVHLVQVNLGNNETWDTHGNAFPHLKDKLFPPTDRALTALLDDLREQGMLQNTLIVVAGEFGRTPKISLLPRHYKTAGRDHWGAVQTVLLAGGGVVGGRVIGSSDKIGGHPKTDPQTPENLAATIYDTLGIPATAAWHDALGRPHHIYHGRPIPGLS